MVVFFYFGCNLVCNMKATARILSRKKLALKKRSFVNLYNTGVNIHSRRLSYDSVVGVARNMRPSHSWPSENIS